MYIYGAAPKLQPVSLFFDPHTRKKTLKLRGGPPSGGRGSKKRDYIFIIYLLSTIYIFFIYIYFYFIYIYKYIKHT